MPKYFVDESLARQSSYAIQGELFHHLKEVLRVREGEVLTLVDCEGYEQEARVRFCHPHQLELELGARELSRAETSYQVNLYQALPKADKLEQIIQKSVELGLQRLIPIQTAYSDVRWDRERGEKKIQRWRKIARSAAEQSGRGRLPEIAAVSSLAEIVTELKEMDLVLLCWEKEKVCSLKAVLQAAVLPQAARLAVLVGPEGGWAPTELEAARAVGAHTVSLGPRILRTETAGPAVLAQLAYELEQEATIKAL